MPNLIGIDVYTVSAKLILRTMRRWRGTIYAESRGVYREGRECTQLVYCGMLTEKELDDRMYKHAYGNGVIGYFTPGN